MWPIRPYASRVASKSEFSSNDDSTQAPNVVLKSNHEFGLVKATTSSLPW